MFPAQRLQVADFASIHEKNSLASRNAPDSRNWNPSNTRWHVLGTGRREQQFVIFTTMQGQLQIEFPLWPAHPGAGNEFGIYLCPHAALFAEVREVGREAVAGVDHCSGQAFLPK